MDVERRNQCFAEQPWGKCRSMGHFQRRPTKFVLLFQMQIFDIYLLIRLFQILDYYRVAYDKDNYRLITEQLMEDHEQIVPNNRAQLLDDTFILASVHTVPYKRALDLSLYLAQEKEYVPWNAVLAEFNYIDSMLHNQAQFPDWTVIIRMKLFSMIILLITFFYVDSLDQIGDSVLRTRRISRIQDGCTAHPLRSH
jgi:hypothetical protein